MIWSGRKTSAVPVSWILCFLWLGFSSENIKNCETCLEFWRGEDQFDPSQVISLPQTSNRKRFLDRILHLESQETSIIILSIGTSGASSGHINLQHIQNHHQMNQMTVHLLGRNVKHDANALDSILMILIPLQVDRPALPKATIWKITNSRSKFYFFWSSFESGNTVIPYRYSTPLSSVHWSLGAPLHPSLRKNKWLMARAAHFLATCNVILLLLWDIFPTSKVVSVALGIQPENEEAIRSSTKVHQNRINNWCHNESHLQKWTSPKGKNETPTTTR